MFTEMKLTATPCPADRRCVNEYRVIKTYPGNEDGDTQIWVDVNIGGKIATLNTAQVRELREALARCLPLDALSKATRRRLRNAPDA